MKISKVQVELSNTDLLSIINEFLEIDGLEIEDIEINNNINIKGSFTKGVKINFQGYLDILGVENGIVNGKFSKLKLMKLGIFRPIRSLGLKYGFKILALNGVTSIKDNVFIDIKKVLNNVPYIDLNISHLFVKDRVLIVEASNIDLSIKGELIKEKIENNQSEEKEEFVDFDELNIEKIHDNYSTGRKVLKDKLTGKTKEYSDYLFVLPDIITLIYRLLKDKRVKLNTKLTICGSLAYLLFPTDIIPDRIPFIGNIDDLAVIFFTLNKIINDVSLQVLVENWEGENDLLLVLKNAVEYISEFTGAKNIEKIYNVISELSTL